MDTASRRTPRRILAAVIISAVVPAVLTASGASTAPSDPVKSVTVPLAPFRILDTRDGTGTGGRVAAVAATGTITVQVAGVRPVPADAVGVVLNSPGPEAFRCCTAAPTSTTRSELP